MFRLRDHIEPRHCGHFITFPDERLITAKRQSPLVLLLPYGSLLLVGLIVAFTTWWFFILVMKDVPLLLTWLILEATFILLCALQIFYGWYYHIYLFTNRKIVEIAYSPPFLRKINDILLDQVRVTEVNVSTHGFIRELLDIGDIDIGFDRLSHDEHILLVNLRKPHELGDSLSQMFEIMMHDRRTWSEQEMMRNRSRNYKFNITPAERAVLH